MMRHQVKCPGRENNGNPECKILHDMNNLPDLLRHIENEIYVKKAKDAEHLGVQLDRQNQNGFKSVDTDLTHIYSYKKHFFEDLETEVRKYVFKPLTAQVKPSVKPSPKKREKKEKLLNDKTGYFYFGKVE